MSKDSGKAGLYARLLACLTALSAAACGVVVPTRPDVEVVRGQPVAIDEGAVISVGPRRLLKEITDEIAKAYPHIKVVDGLLFRDTTFPAGGWQLETLFQPGVTAGR